MSANYLILIKKQLLMDEWVCIYNNVVSEHDLKQANNYFSSLGMRPFVIKEIEIVISLL
jgi:hypothetical protein